MLVTTTPETLNDRTSYGKMAFANTEIVKRDSRIAANNMQK